MLDLRAFQAELYAALCQQGENRCFLKLCKDDGALWVTDLPKRSKNPGKVRKALEALPVTCKTHEATGLWRLDFTTDEWSRRLNKLPDQLPPLPGEERFHAAYALCRLLLLHQAPLERQPMEITRAAVKAAQGAQEKLLAAVPVWQSRAAVMLRQGQALPGAAGRVLAAWLAQQETAIEKEHAE